jgi:hypothetical protein
MAIFEAEKGWLSYLFSRERGGANSFTSPFYSSIEFKPLKIKAAPKDWSYLGKPERLKAPCKFFVETSAEFYHKGMLVAGVSMEGMVDIDSRQKEIFSWRVVNLKLRTLDLSNKLNQVGDWRYPAIQYQQFVSLSFNTHEGVAYGVKDIEDLLVFDSL